MKSFAPHFAALAVSMALATLGCTREPDAGPSANAAAAPLAGKRAAPTPAATQEDADLARAKDAAKAFSSRLRGQLLAKMVDGGPMTAVDVCNTQAPRIADEVMAEYGVQLGRVAVPDRHRNPANVAGDWKLETVQSFQQAVAGGAAAADQVAVIRDGLPQGVALRMMRGIVTEPGCLACHGTNVVEPLRATIARHYPNDHATGFEVGDLRGALWVEVPATPGDDPDAR